MKQVAVTYKLKYFVAVAKSEEVRELDLEKVKESICKDDINVSEED